LGAATITFLTRTYSKSSHPLQSWLAHISSYEAK